MSDKNEYVKSNARKVFLFVSKNFIRILSDVLAYIATFFNKKQLSQLPPIDDYNLITPAIKLSNQIKSGHISCEEVVESFISRVKRINPIINAVVCKRFDIALKEARKIDFKIQEALDGNGNKSILSLPLLGIPVSIKEVIAVQGCSYTGGVVKRANVKAPKNAESVELLIKAGMIPIALTNVPEMAIWWDSDNQVYGRTLNPYDLSRIAGGSSGGEAALISAAGSLVGLGSDFAGSIRIPANFCGIFGHKPTPFIVSNDGLYPSIRGSREKLLAVGPMTRYACDLRPMLKVLARNKASKLQLDEPVDLKKLRIFWLEDNNDPLTNKTEPEILNGIRSAVEYLSKKFNVETKKVSFNEMRYGVFLWSAEANTVESPKMSLYFKEGKDEMHPRLESIKKLFNKSHHTYNGIFATYVERQTPCYGTSKHSYLSKQATNFRESFNNLLGDNGILLMPTHPQVAVAHQVTALKAFNLAYTAVLSVLQAPITQCPLGMTKEGLPFGTQILSKPFNDRLTIAVAEELERAFGGWKAPCKVALD